MTRQDGDVLDTCVRIIVLFVIIIVKIWWLSKIDSTENMMETLTQR